MLLEMLEDFMQMKLLYWIEACSLLGELQTALVGLDEVQRWITVSLAIHLINISLIDNHLIMTRHLE